MTPPDFEQPSTLRERLERMQPAPVAPAPDPDTSERRLELLTDQCAEIVRRWAVTSERHARAVSRFESNLAEWSDAGNRLQQDATQRILELEKLVHHEREDLRQLQDEPIRQLHEQAATLTQVCISTAAAAQQNFERSEARLAAIEAEFTGRMSEITGELQTVVAELRGFRSQNPELPPSAAAPWSLEGVTKLHHQIRQEGNGADAGVGLATVTPAAIARPATTLLPEVAASLTDRIDTIERNLSARDEWLRTRDTKLREAVEGGTQRIWTWGMVTALSVIVVIAAGIAWKARNDVQVAAIRVVEAERTARSAADAAAKQVEETRARAADQIKVAADSAARAQTIGDILAAPDLIRYNLMGQSSLAGATARVSWSRSRGLVFSGLRLAPAPAGATYQVWLVTRSGGTFRAATFAPENGAATVVVPPPTVPRPVAGAIVSLERSTTSNSPSSDVVLVRRPVLPF